MYYLPRCILYAIMHCYFYVVCLCYGSTMHTVHTMDLWYMLSYYRLVYAMYALHLRCMIMLLILLQSTRCMPPSLTDMIILPDVRLSLSVWLLRLLDSRCLLHSYCLTSRLLDSCLLDSEVGCPLCLLSSVLMCYLSMMHAMYAINNACCHL